jgi:hypothetical protein
VLKRWSDGDRYFGHRKDRLTVAAVEDVVVAILAAMTERRNVVSVFLDRKEHGWLRAIIVP